jgi:hypothetical protein
MTEGPTQRELRRPKQDESRKTVLMFWAFEIVLPILQSRWSLLARFAQFRILAERPVKISKARTARKYRGRKYLVIQLLDSN